MEFPDGYDTVVGDRGIRLSGGQRQRIAIARAVVGPARRSSSSTRRRARSTASPSGCVQQAIDRVIQGATSIVIAHRLSTVLHADKIVVLGRGRVEAVGRHAELLGVQRNVQPALPPPVRRGGAAERLTRAERNRTASTRIR